MSKNQLLVTVPGHKAFGSSSPSDEITTVNVDIDGGEGPGSGIHFSVTLNPTFERGIGRHSWIIRAEQGTGDPVPQMFILARVACPLMPTDQTLKSKERGTTERRQITCCGLPFRAGQCTPDPSCTGILDEGQIGLGVEGYGDAVEYSCEITAA